jgi:rare lipoprotein A
VSVDDEKMVTHRRQQLFGLLIFFSFVFLGGCSSSPRFTKDVSGSSRNTPSDSRRSLQTIEGIASFYSTEFHGRKTANGETFDMYKMTAAHRTFPFNTKLRVTNLENKRSIIVRVNDRGPFKMHRIIDLSYAAAAQLSMLSTGTAKVRLEVLEWGDAEYVR